MSPFARTLKAHNSMPYLVLVFALFLSACAQLQTVPSTAESSSGDDVSSISDNTLDTQAEDSDVQASSADEAISELAWLIDDYECHHKDKLNDYSEASSALQSSSLSSELNSSLALISGDSANEKPSGFERRPSPVKPSESKAELKPQNDLWERIRDGFQLDLTVSNPRIDVQFNWYKRNPKYIERTFTRAQRYLFHIVEQIEKHQLPMELALLPVVESAFDPFAYSHGRASGLWQFIPGTGKMFGLHQNWWMDGRRDVTASTQAAIDYLSSLNKRFDGDWMHALASYNTGSGRVRKAIRNNKKRNKPTDFWNLKLPRETRAYVPKLIAISKLVADPERYGITLPPIKNEAVFEAVTFDSQLDLAQAAQLAEINIEELYRFNPAFNQWATPPQGPHRLLLPIGQVEIFKQNLAKLPKSARVSWERYKVRSGDSLIKIAKRFHTTPKLIRQVNKLRNNTIRVKQTLLIPVSSKSHDFYDLSSGNRLSSKQKRIRAPKGTNRITHIVEAGDTFWDLSRKHKVGMRAIAKWNGMAPTDVLKPGTELLIYSKTQAQSEALQTVPSLPDQRQMIRKVGYKVRRGDSLSKIAGRFGVSVNQLVSWNGLNRKKYLKPGQRLTIYVDITRG